MTKQQPVAFFDAYIKIDVRCKLADDTKIPSGYCMAIGEPDKNGLIEYALSGNISRDQLQKIYAILQQPVSAYGKLEIARQALQEIADTTFAVAEEDGYEATIDNMCDVASKALVKLGKPEDATA